MPLISFKSFKITLLLIITTCFKTYYALSITSDCGHAHSCVLAINNGIKCWGKNDCGQLGYGDNNTRGDAGNEMGSNLLELDLGSDFIPTHIALGGYHSCALSTDNSIKCWGFNAYGQLGYGDNNNRGNAGNEMSDNLLELDLGSDFIPTHIALGAQHSCAVSTNNIIKCWGLNSDGQLGYGDTNSRGVAVNELDLGSDFIPTQIDLGRFHSCALSTNNYLKCWGRNHYGQLGYGDNNTRGDAGNEMSDNLLVLDLGSDFIATHIALGFYHSCALSSNNSIKCWGRNHVGQLGYGDTDNRGDAGNQMGSNLLELDLGSDFIPTHIALGGFHSCALSTNNGIKCWGHNLYGQLGYDDQNNRGVAGNQMGSNLLELDLGSDFIPTHIALGAYHSCALSTNNYLKCWGRNNYGQLGYGDNNTRGDAGNLLEVDVGSFTPSPTTDPTADPTGYPTSSEPTTSELTISEPTTDATIDPTFDATFDQTAEPTVYPTTLNSSYINVSYNSYNIYTLIAMVFTGLFLLIGIISYIDSRFCRRNDFFKLSSVFVSAVHTFDLLTDIFFAIHIGEKIYDNQIFGILFLCCLVFIIVPIMISIGQLLHQIRKHWWYDDIIKMWLTKHLTFLLFLSVITGSSFTAVQLINSNIFQVSYFSMDLNNKQFISFQQKRLYSIVLVENVPQVALQCIYLWIMQDFEAIAISSLIFSVISILIAIGTMITSKQILNSQGHGVVQFDVTGSVIDTKKCRNQTKEIENLLSDALGLNKELVEVLKPYKIPNGLRVQIHIHLNHILSRNQDYKKLLNDYQQNGKLAEILKTSWNLQSGPNVSSINFTVSESKDRIKGTIPIKIDNQQRNIQTNIQSKQESMEGWNNVNIELSAIPEIKVTPGIDTGYNEDSTESENSIIGETTIGIDDNT